MWDYDIGVASEAARAGFDEIQFDCVRMTGDAGLALPQTVSPMLDLSRMFKVCSHFRRQDDGTIERTAHHDVVRDLKNVELGAEGPRKFPAVAESHMGGRLSYYH